jgi:hypothetical protein
VSSDDLRREIEAAERAARVLKEGLRRARALVAMARARLTVLARPDGG